jgi:murein L,D-transpeptidase YcbB/YkuD
MHKKRLNHLLAGAAVTAGLALTISGNSVFAQSSQPVLASVPASEAASQAAPAAARTAPQSEAEKPAPAAAPAVPAAAAPVAPAPSKETTGNVQYQVASAEVDAQIADKLRELSNGKFDRLVGGRKERASIEAFYSERNFAPLWITNGAINPRGNAATDYLAHVDEHGLEPGDYPSPEFKAGAEVDALTEAELKLTLSVITFARHAQIGRVHYSRIASDILYEQDRPEPAEVLKKIVTATSTADALDSFHPPHPGYKALRAKLAEVRKTPDGAPQRIPGGITLKYGKDKKGNEVLMQDPRVPALRAKLGAEGDAESKVYDKALAEAVTKFQKSNKLQANGQLNTATLDAINGPRRDRDADVIVANLERWRWMPRDLGKIYVMVNIPDYTLKIVRDGQLYWQTKIVVGKPSQATPITSAEMKFITVNPTWNVPPSIIQNEYLPALAQDPGALERIGLKIQQNPDGTVRIWQPPGDRNALGRIRFNFPNKFLVYQHDTPDKHLFAHDKRAYSHGCMRVNDPLMYGEKILSLVLPQENYTAERLRKMFGGSEININFPFNIPVHLTYQSAYVDDAGKLVIREDIYGRDARVIAALKGSERKVADIPMDRPKPNFAAPVRAAPGTYGGATSASGGFSFFDRLFGAPAPVVTPPKPVQRQRSADGNNNSARSWR